MIQPENNRTLIFDTEQQAFLEASNATQAIGLVGPPGSGKTSCLITHLQRRLAMSAGEHRVLLLTTADPTSLSEAADTILTAQEITQCWIGNLQEFASQCLRQHAAALGFVQPPEIMSKQESFRRFIKVADPLLSLELPQLLSGEIDPEVSGLRYPERFLQTTFRLFERLRAANIDPLEIQAQALRGTMTFYSAPPNFADTELLRATKEKYRDSLRVTSQELEHQRRREVDLTRIVGKLAVLEAEQATLDGRFSPAQTVFHLRKLLQHHPPVALTVRREFPYAAIDEAQDLNESERQLLRVIYGEDYAGLAIVGMSEISLRQNAVLTSQKTFGLVCQRYTVYKQYRGTATIWRTHAAIMAPLGGAPSLQLPVESLTQSVQLLRTLDQKTEAQQIASSFASRIAQGVAPASCALVLRSLHCAWPYVEALLAANIPVDLIGPLNPLWDRRVADAHALLWALADRSNAAAFLRLLQSPLLRLSDRAVALLCAQPGAPTLLALEPLNRSRQPRNPQLLAQNILDGSNDTALDSETRARLEAFRTRWNGWVAQISFSHDIDSLAKIVAQSGLTSGRSVSARLSRAMCSRYFCELASHYRTMRNEPNLKTLLADYDELNQREIEHEHSPRLDPSAVIVTSAEAVRGYAFDVVAIADAQAGAFPRYFVPDSFLYSPLRGFVPVENVGSTGAARTAKWSWYVHATRAGESYHRNERHMFANAISRANQELFISASGAATRGIAAPEFLEELRRAKIYGVSDLTKKK